MPNSGTINSQNKLDPCKLNVSKGGGDPTAKWINQTGGSLTLNSNTLGQYFNDASGASVVPPLTIATGNPSQDGGLTIYLKPSVDPPSGGIPVPYTITGVTCARTIDTGSDPSIQIDA
jgi:hypothetical protein